MFTRKKTVESESRKTRNLLLRLFSSNDTARGSLVSLESTDEEDSYRVNPITMRYALLEADYQNARALLAFQKNERFH